MSADLFAEYGSAPSSNPQQQVGPGHSKAPPAPSFSFFDDLTTTTPASVPQTQSHQATQDFQAGGYGRNAAPVVEDNDDWGDFEDGASLFEPAVPVKHDPFAFSAPQASHGTWPSASHPNDAFALTTQATLPLQSDWRSAPAQNDPFAFNTAQPAPPSQAIWQQARVIKAKASVDSNVLFDADNAFGDDADFGDFEEAEFKSPVTTMTTSSGGATELLGDLGLSLQPSVVIESGRGVSTQPKASIVSKKEATSGFACVATEREPGALASSKASQEHSWDAFDDWESIMPTKVSTKASSKPKGRQVNGVPRATAALSTTSDDAQPGELPPTNVPPPAVLLSLFPPLFSEAQTKLFKPMTAQTLPMRNKLLAEPATIAYLQGYLMLASVAAQIIAGRKLRWKRDRHLAQGMRIGPASSRATSGMKLASIDKSENMKEEREASDVVQGWKEQIGRLRHVVSAVNQITAGTLGSVPDMQENMTVKVLKQGEGGVPAPQPCMLCGLKRDERIGGSEQRVEDSFGEWWVEQVNMHRGMLFSILRVGRNG